MSCRSSGSGSSPWAIWSRMAGWMLASSRSRLTERRFMFRAVATPCSFQPWSLPSMALMCRHRSTEHISARTTFSASARIASAPSSAPRTKTGISLSLALIEQRTRRSPATITRSSPSWRTSGGWISPWARMLAASWASCSGIALVRRGLLGLNFSLRGMTFLSSTVLLLGRLLSVLSISGEDPSRARGDEGQQLVYCRGPRWTA